MNVEKYKCKIHTKILKLTTKKLNLGRFCENTQRRCARFRNSQTGKGLN